LGGLILWRVALVADEKPSFDAARSLPGARACRCPIWKAAEPLVARPLHDTATPTAHVAEFGKAVVQGAKNVEALQIDDADRRRSTVQTSFDSGGAVPADDLVTS
jgi:hypothetical protein